ncbi:Os01g0596600 [Oryza sativa Japonica Group]|uniref:Os01g0596600 protein n=1 Tax=Oryza sativa subsp. japonica TaxID=39947 RepID=A0A0P0V4U2_ORYSJ|nr:Os01g0596600 [Oryza sativa Japonica Group]
MVARVSSILSSHPGPFNSIHLTCSSMGSHNDALKSWFKAFADKHLKELAFLNLNYPNDIMVPTDLFCCKSLKRLYLGGVQLPANTGIIPCSHTFHELWEICLYRCILHEWDIENLLTCSPKVEKLSLVNSACGWPLRLHIRSHSLRCMLHWASSLEELAMVSTPCLERLILWRDDALHWSDCKKIKICSMPKLQVIGYLNPADHVLQIRDTVIKEWSSRSPNDMKASAATVVPSVEVLAMTIRFGVHEEERMSIARTQTTNEVNLEFWKDVGSIQCVRSIIKRVIFDDFSGEECELAFLSFIAQNANQLEEIYIIPSKKDLSAGSSLGNVINHFMSSILWASAYCRDQYREPSKTSQQKCLILKYKDYAAGTAEQAREGKIKIQRLESCQALLSR